MFVREKETDKFKHLSGNDIIINALFADMTPRTTSYLQDPISFNSLCRSNNYSGIYIIKSIKREKVYIGSSNNIYIRLKQHYYSLKNNKHYNIHLQNHTNKHGINDLEIYLLPCNENDLLKNEQWYLDDFDKTLRFNLANDVKRPSLEWVTSKEFKQARREEMKERWKAKPAGKVRKARCKKGYKQNEFANLIGISQTALSFIENGKSKPQELTKQKINDVLDTNL